jgi:hypothetical protein
VTEQVESGPTEGEARVVLLGIVGTRAAGRGLLSDGDLPSAVEAMASYAGAVTNGGGGERGA